LGYTTITLKQLLQGATFSRGFPDFEVHLPERVTLCRSRHRYPKAGDGDSTDGNESPEGSDGENDDGVEDIEQENDHRQRMDNYIQIDLKNEDVNHVDKVFLNAAGAPWDAFSFLYYVDEDIAHKILGMIMRAKKTDPEAINPMVIDQKLFDVEYNKVTNAIKKVPVDAWFLLFVTNADSKGLSVRNKPNSAFISRKEFQEYYGYTYSSRAQFAFANEKIFVNSAPAEALEILGLNFKDCIELCRKRKWTPLNSIDDIGNALDMGKSKLKRFKRDHEKHTSFEY